jgi:hypothetical protein
VSIKRADVAETPIDEISVQSNRRRDHRHLGAVEVNGDAVDAPAPICRSLALAIRLRFAGYDGYSRYGARNIDATVR